MSRSTFVSRRALVATVAALSIPLSASAPALARPADDVLPNGATVEQVQPKGDAHDGYGMNRSVPAPDLSGDTQADFGKPVVVAQPKVGDDPATFPGASGAPKTAPVAPIEIVRPERTIVQDADPTLAIILAALALLVALAGSVMVLAQRRTLRAH